jgi:hypothetical protein
MTERWLKFLDPSSLRLLQFLVSAVPSLLGKYTRLWFIAQDTQIPVDPQR